MKTAIEFRLDTRTPGSVYGDTPGRFTLTNQHPASSYGIPVLTDDNGQAWGPANVIADSNEVHAFFGDALPALLAGDVVAEWVASNPVTAEEEEACRAYLAQASRELPVDLEDSRRRAVESRIAADAGSAYDR